MDENSSRLYPITSKPGVKRDGSLYAGNYYTDAQWCRFMRGLPRKMGGYRLIGTGLPGSIIRKILVIPEAPNFNVYLGAYDEISYLTIDRLGNDVGGAFIDRTPVGYVPNADNIWQMDTMFITTNIDSNYLIAHAAPNLSNIDSTVNGAVYYGDASASTALTPTGFSVSGGILVLNPYLVMFGNNGQVIISRANDPTAQLFAGRPTSSKIVFGLQTRAGTASPGGLLWSLNSLIRMTTAVVNDTPTFAFDTVTDESSILSSSAVIEYDGKYLWPGIDRFLLYNGTVIEVQNNLSLLWFYENLNYQYRQKVWATKVPLYGEIWIWFPYGNSTEANQAVIFNIRENIWYDTRMDSSNPLIGRAAGYFPQTFQYPIWSDLAGNVWQHEVGRNRDEGGGQQFPILSYFQPSAISWASIDPSGNWSGVNNWVTLDRVEPEFWQQSGNIDLFISGSEFANSPQVTTGPYSLDVLTTRDDLRETRRYMFLKFVSNELDGHYELGQLLLTVGKGDARA